MKCKSKMLIQILLFALLGATCHKNTVPPQDPPAAIPTASEYFPNSVGDYWEYYVYDSSAFNGIPEYTVKVSITNTQKLVDGKDATVWQYQYPWGNDTNYVRTVGDTIKVYDKFRTETIRGLEFPLKIFLIPFQDGQRWNGKLLYVDTSYVSSKPIIKTKFYVFDSCFKIYHHYLGPNLEFKDEYWFRANIGMIQIHYNDYSLGPIKAQLWQLKKYYLH